MARKKATQDAAARPSAPSNPATAPRKAAAKEAAASNSAPSKLPGRPKFRNWPDMERVNKAFNNGMPPTEREKELEQRQLAFGDMLPIPVNARRECALRPSAQMNAGDGVKNTASMEEKATNAGDAINEDKAVTRGKRSLEYDSSDDEPLMVKKARKDKEASLAKQEDSNKPTSKEWNFKKEWNFIARPSFAPAGTRNERDA